MSAARSRTPTALIAEKLSEYVEHRFTRHRYSKVILVGYSLGALLARKAFVFAMGQNQDAPINLPAVPR